MTEHDIHALLDIACADVDVAVGTTSVIRVSDLAAADLRRAHAARARRRARYAALGAAGLALIGVGGLGVAGLRDDAPAPVANVPDPSAHNQQIRLVAKHLDADPYEFSTTPAGWAVQGSTPFAVTIAPVDGSVSDDPADFSGKLVITLNHGDQAGDALTYDGREFVKRGDSGYTILVTHTRPGEPDGWVAVQFPDDAGWTSDTMLKFLSSVHVTSSAKAGHG